MWLSTQTHNQLEQYSRIGLKHIFRFPVPLCACAGADTLDAYRQTRCRQTLRIARLQTQLLLLLLLATAVFVCRFERVAVMHRRAGTCLWRAAAAVADAAARGLVQ